MLPMSTCPAGALWLPEPPTQISWPRTQTADNWGARLGVGGVGPMVGVGGVGPMVGVGARVEVTAEAGIEE